eukprot:TRINITY_DN7761_c0_g2_i1.p1 TRINITY_DN7761_c0_g2~~TRINITY_DN7761_c0_g2_i1.p1  ORF type:complete len:486 (-),score=55.88 TRINITY_DN7761_c0_g2_i1:45-1502(-)
MLPQETDSMNTSPATEPCKCHRSGESLPDCISKGDSKNQNQRELARYLSESIFNNRPSSDISLEILGQEYYLHRVILCRSPYFKSLLSDQWKDDAKNKITIGIDDENITTEAVNLALRSLYGDTRTSFTKNNQFSLLATGTFFALDTFCMDCIDFIAWGLDIDDVIECAVQCTRYDHNAMLKNACMALLLQEGSTALGDQLHLLPLSMLKEVLSSDAFWVSCEFDRYQLLKKIVNHRNEHRARLSQQQACDMLTDEPCSGGGPANEGPAALVDLPRDDEKCEHELFQQAFASLQLASLKFEQLVQVRQDGLLNEDQIHAALWSHEVQRLGICNPGRKIDSAPVKFRFGVKFEDFASMAKGATKRSSKHFFAGSMWSVEVRMQEDRAEDGKYLSVFLFRDRNDDSSLYKDDRQTVSVKFQLYTPRWYSKCTAPFDRFPSSKGRTMGGVGRTFFVARKSWRTVTFPSWMPACVGWCASRRSIRENKP